MGVGQETGLAAAARVRLRVAFRQYPQVTARITGRTAGKTHPPIPAIVHLRIAPGTVMGTVRTVAPEVSF
jgi:hypothetical protein